MTCGSNTDRQVRGRILRVTRGPEFCNALPFDAAHTAMRSIREGSSDLLQVASPLIDPRRKRGTDARERDSAIMTAARNWPSRYISGLTGSVRRTRGIPHSQDSARAADKDRVITACDHADTPQTMAETGLASLQRARGPVRERLTRGAAILLHLRRRHASLPDAAAAIDPGAALAHVTAVRG